MPAVESPLWCPQNRVQRARIKMTVTDVQLKKNAGLSGCWLPSTNYRSATSEIVVLKGFYNYFLLSFAPQLKSEIGNLAVVACLSTSAMSPSFHRAFKHAIDLFHWPRTRVQMFVDRVIVDETRTVFQWRSARIHSSSWADWRALGIADVSQWKGG